MFASCVAAGLQPTKGAERFRLCNARSDLASGLQIQLSEYLFDMPLRCPPGDDEPFGNLSISKAVSHQRGHLYFTSRKTPEVFVHKPLPRVIKPSKDQ